MRWHTNTSRRRFLGGGLRGVLAASVAPVFVPASVFGAGGGVAAGSRVAVAVVGMGSRGLADLHSVMYWPEAQIVAVSDVYQPRMKEARWRVNKHLLKHEWSWGCDMEADFQKVVTRKDIDAVLVATPEHWHVLIALAAVRAGKHVYLEKAMGLSLEEDQVLRAEVRRRKPVFQFGTQQRSSREFQRAVELVRNGRIGRVRRIEVWAPASRPGGSVAPAPVPAGLDYDRWLGPAPDAPHTLGRCIPPDPVDPHNQWWFHTDYSIGFLANWGIHPMDIALWGHPGLLRGVLEVEGRRVVPKEGFCNTAVAFDISYRAADGVELRFRGTPNEYPDRSPLNDFSDLEARLGEVPYHGTLFEGTEGWLEVHRGGIRTYPESLVEDPLREVPFKVRPSGDHAKDWLDAIREGREAVSGIEEAVQSDLLCHLGHLASRLGRRLRFDPGVEHFVGDAEADGMLRARPMRAPWKLTA